MDFVANISTCQNGLCPRLSPQESFDESWHNENWAILAGLPTQRQTTIKVVTGPSIQQLIESDTMYYCYAMPPMGRRH